MGRNQRRVGAATAELAIVLPVLVTLVLGCIDLGRFASSYVAVSGAARSGAGAGSEQPYTSATLSAWQAYVGQAVKDEMADYDPALVTVAANPVPEQGGDSWQAVVEVSYPFTTVVSWPGLPAQFPVCQTVAMRSTRP